MTNILGWSMRQLLKWWKNRSKASRRRRANEIGWDGFLRAQLEPRVLFATNLGTLDVGRLYLPNQTMTGALTSDGLTKYTFTVPDSHVDIYMSMEAFEILQPELGMTLEGVASTDESIAQAEPKFLAADLAAGTYTLDIRNPDLIDRDKTLVINVDSAAGGGVILAPDGSVIPGAEASARSGRDLGTLSAGAAASVREFVGGYNNDLIADYGDNYFFDIPTSGTVSATLDQLAADVAGGLVSQTVTIYRDFDEDGLFEANEVLAKKGGVVPGAGGAASATLSSGHYGVVVTPLPGIFNRVGGSSYRLRLSYTPPDTGGNSLAAATNVGTVGGAIVTRTDYVSAADSTDVYKFTTVAGGPFVFDANVGGLFPGSDNLVQLILDANGNNVIDKGELLASEETFNGSGVHLSASLAAGTYLVRVSRVAGEGPYSLFMVARNTDQGGPASFPTNINFNTSALGMKEIVDTVSATDLEDVFRFDVESVATIRASFPVTALGTDANLQLVRDSNNNNVLDAGDALLRSSNNASNAGESIAASATPGKYLLRVVRAAGTPQYDLTVNADYAGSFPSTARGMTLTGADSSTIEFLGPGADTVDFYRLNVSGPIQLNAFMFNLGDQVTLSVGRDDNRDQVIDPAETLLSKALPLGTGDRETVNLLSAGTYYVKVTFTGTVGLNYGITFASAPVDNAGNSFSDARNLGGLVSPLTFSDFVGDGSINAADDLDDFYRFDAGTAGPYVFVGQAPFVSPGASIAMQLIRDNNRNGHIDTGEVIATTSAPPNFGVPPLVATIDKPGTYYVHIVRTSGEANYTASFAAFSTDTAGNTVAATARSLGAFSDSSATLTSGTAFVGRIDRDDLYTVDVTNDGELSLALADATPSAFIAIAPVPPFTGVTTPFEFETIFESTPIDRRASSARFGPDLIQGFVVSPGKYIIRVHSEIDTNYNLSVSYAPELPFGSNGPLFLASGLPTSGATIQAEDFDRGGEGVAYHDATAGNSGNSGRDTDVDLFANPGGGFRVDGADAGEFLNYSIFAEANGFFDIDVAAGAAASGGTFHIELDGAPVGTLQSLPVPVTGSNSTFAAVTASHVFVSQGPHILRLAIDSRGASQTSAGGFDSLTIRRSQTDIGTFTLTPQHATTDSHGRAILAVQWTVPGNSWHDLTTIDIRLRDEAGRAIWLRFDEASNTLRLYNSHSGKFGPARKIGSRGFLLGDHVAIDLSQVSIAAAGPDSPTVTLTIGMKFLGARTRHFVVDLAASNDAGFIGDFVEAGTLDVIHRRN